MEKWWTTVWIVWCWCWRVRKKIWIVNLARHLTLTKGFRWRRLQSPATTLTELSLTTRRGQRWKRPESSWFGSRPVWYWAVHVSNLPISTLWRKQWCSITRVVWQVAIPWGDEICAKTFQVLYHSWYRFRVENMYQLQMQHFIFFHVCKYHHDEHRSPNDGEVGQAAVATVFLATDNGIFPGRHQPSSSFFPVCKTIVFVIISMPGTT